MKKQKISGRKLQLNKKTIARLDQQKSRHVLGGATANGCSLPCPCSVGETQETCPSVHQDTCADTCLITCQATCVSCPGETTPVTKCNTVCAACCV